MGYQLKKKLPLFLEEKGHKSFDEIYLKYREEFRQFAIRYGSEGYRADDIYQDAFIAFYENISSGKLKELTSSAKTYLFSIGKYIMLNDMKKNHKEIKQELNQNVPNLDPDVLEKIELTERQELILSHIRKLGVSCQKVLIYFYYNRLGIREIMEAMDYNSENVTKSKKSQCLKQLKSTLNQHAI